MSSAPKVGDRVRVTYEGVITAVSGAYGDRGRQVVRFRRDGDDSLRSAYSEYVTVIEPAYEVGSVYVSAMGTLFYRLMAKNGPASWRRIKDGTVRRHEIPQRPLRKLVPEADE